MTAPARIVSVGAVVATMAGDDAILAAALTEAGIAVDSRIVVDDDAAAIERALAADGLTVIVAGAGGSAGDAVRRAIARATGARLVLNHGMLAALEDAQRRRDRPLARRDERLSLLPQGAAVWRLEDEPAWVFPRDAAPIVVVPRGAAGSPTLARHLVELAAAGSGRGVTLTRVLRTAGLSLADVEERIAEFIGAEAREVTVGTVGIDGEAWVRLRARGATREAALAALAPIEAAVAARLGDDVYGRDGESLEQALAQRLRARGLTLAVAESCTGGLVGHRLTGVPGSSAWFERGVIVYSNRAKEELLGVPATVLATDGAVSAACATAMVRGICRLAGSACGIAITGIAGPDGGTPTKPVGTVFIAVAVGEAVTTRQFRFDGDRAAVKWRSSEMALEMLRRALGGA